MLKDHEDYEGMQSDDQLIPHSFMYKQDKYRTTPGAHTNSIT